MLTCKSPHIPWLQAALLRCPRESETTDHDSLTLKWALKNTATLTFFVCGSCSILSRSNSAQSERERERREERANKEIIFKQNKCCLKRERERVSKEIVLKQTKCYQYTATSNQMLPIHSNLKPKEGRGLSDKPHIINMSS